MVGEAARSLRVKKCETAGRKWTVGEQVSIGRSNVLPCPQKSYSPIHSLEPRRRKSHLARGRGRVADTEG